MRKNLQKFYIFFFVKSVPDPIQLFRIRSDLAKKDSDPEHCCNYELYSYLYSWMSHTPIVFLHRFPPKIHKVFYFVQLQLKCIYFRVCSPNVLGVSPCECRHDLRILMFFHCLSNGSDNSQSFVTFEYCA
jgi:hypothetical protein